MSRRSWAGVLVLAAGMSVALEAHPAGADDRDSRAEARLPWPVFVGTSEGRFSIRPTGAVVRLSRDPWRTPRPRIPRGWIGPPRGPFGHIRNGHVVLTQRGRTLWESRSTFALGDHANLWDFSAWNSGVTFQFRRRAALYVSIRGRPEVRVGRGLFAEGITRTGHLITLRSRTRTLESWDSATLRPTVLARHLSLQALDSSYFDRRTGTFVYWTRTGTLVRTDGVHRRPLANYRALGFSAQPDTYLLQGGLIELLSRTWHEVVLRGDGSVFARARAPSGGSVAGFGDQAAARDGGALAYVLSPMAGHPRSTVFLLKAGSSAGRTLYSGPGRMPCALAVSWRATWILFAPGPVVLDSTGTHEPIALRRLVTALPGRTRMVRWAYRPHGAGSPRPGRDN